MAKYSVVMTPTPCSVSRCIVSIRSTYSCSRALTYLFTYTVGSVRIKPAISPKRMKKEQKLLLTAYIKSYTGFRYFAVNMYDFEWSLSEIQGHWFLKCRKNDEIAYSLLITPTPCRVDGGISVRPTYSCARALTYSLTYLLTQNNQCFGDLPVILFPDLSYVPLPLVSPKIRNVHVWIVYFTSASREVSSRQQGSCNL